MVHHSTTADGRDERAGDRDDAADRRDDAARDRDATAQQRDVDAEERFAGTPADADDLAVRLHRISLRILDRLARIENVDLHPADWADLPPAALARLEALVAEQCALARLDRQALYALLDDLHDAVEELRRGHQAAARDRRAAGRDRHHSLGDRDDSGQDRHDARADRHQSAVDREQVDPRDLPGENTAADPGPTSARPADGTGSRLAQAVSASRQRIAESRSRLDGIGRGRAVAPGPDDPPASSGPGG